MRWLPNGNARDQNGLIRYLWTRATWQKSQGASSQRNGSIFNSVDYFSNFWSHEEDMAQGLDGGGSVLSFSWFGCSFHRLVHESMVPSRAEEGGYGK